MTVAGIGGTSALAFLAVRRARARRRREIEGAGEARPALSQPKRRGLQAADLEPEPAPEPEELEEESPAPELASEAAETAPDRIERAERPPGQVLPFPTPAPAEEKPVKPKRDVAALSSGLARTRAGWVSRLGGLFSGKKEIDPALVDEIEKVLLTADIGVRTSQKLLEEIRGSLGRAEIKDPAAVWTYLRKRSAEILAIDAPPLDLDVSRPFVLLVIGVNGSGKTTTIGKLAAKLKEQGKSVLLAAGDTFRAAATEQLEIWGQRTGAPVVRGKEGADPSSVLFEAVKRAKAENIDVVIADTAGRLHTKTNLMEELQKVRRVIGKAQEGAPHETWLVIDSTSGQNAIAQAQMFTQAMAVTGIVLTKLDGTAKGGVILGITDQLKLPVRYIGVGERVEDLRDFDPEEFVDALLEAAPDASLPA
ncbi:MAG TPA: signal recognition particle-docking protein FtsY [Polyangia bacterium]|nr:signal recognition particle-docking protein FtsY [Polyangia bacterium]